MILQKRSFECIEKRIKRLWEFCAYHFSLFRWNATVYDGTVHKNIDHYNIAQVDFRD